MMQALVLLALLVATASAVPFRPMQYSFVVPSEEDPDQMEGAQFHIVDDDGTYSWGYKFKGRVHMEGRDSQGQVSGSFGFIDPNGVLVVRNYKAHPELGFQFETDGASEIAPDSDLAKYRDIVVDNLSPKTVEEPVPVKYTAQLEAKPQLPLAEDAPKPSIYLAQDIEGKPVKIAQLVGESQAFKSQAQFRVAQDVVDSAKGVSELAARLDAFPVAAVHDSQLSPQQRAAEENANRPVLLHYEDVRDPQTYDLLFPVSEQK